MKRVRNAESSRIDAIMEAVDAAIITIDGDGTIADINDATTRLFGYSRNELLGSNVKRLMPEPYRSNHDQYLADHLRTGVNKIIGSGRKVSAINKIGSIFPVHLSVAKFDDGNRTRFTGIIHDLTELDEAHSLNDRLGLIIEESFNEVYTIDINTLRFSSANRAAQDNLGYSLDEIKQMTPLNVVDGLDENALRATLAPLLNGEKNRRLVQSIFIRKDSTCYDAEGFIHYSTAVYPPEIAVIVQDITEKKRLSETLRRNQRVESIGNLTGGIAHDFHNILTIIMGNLDLLRDEVTGGESNELISDARDAAEMGARLTKRLLAFARRSPLTPATVNINGLIEDLTTMLERTLGGGVALEVLLADTLWDTEVDESALENAVVNLAINARDAMPGGGQLIIETANCLLDDETILDKDLSAGEYVRLSVTDTGSGIPDNIKNSIFEPFVTTKKGGKGTGLGLSMVFGFVRQSGGAISVYSEVEKGTMFSIYLPRSNRSTSTVVEGSEEVENSASGKVILIAEDDPRVRKLTVKRLHKLGHQVIEAEDAFKALQLFKSTEHVDLVFSDVVMTEGMTGYDLALAIGEIDSQFPVLLTSGYAEDVINAKKLQESGLSLLRKPYHQSDLEQALERIFTSASS